jgi:hypothetical protein
MVLGHEAHQTEVRNAILGAGTDPTDQLRQAVRSNVGFHLRWPLLTIVCNSELHALAPDNATRVLALRHDVGVLVAAVIDRGNLSGAFHCQDTWLAMSAIAGMGVRVAWWYPSEAVSWLPEADHTVDAIADAYAEFALDIVKAQRP